MRSILCDGDKTVGHDGYPPVAIPASQTRFRFRGKAVLLEGDGGVEHCRRSCHSVYIARGTSKIRLGGVRLALAGDPTTCGDTMANPGYPFQSG